MISILITRRGSITASLKKTQGEDSDEDIKKSNYKKKDNNKYKENSEQEQSEEDIAESNVEMVFGYDERLLSSKFNQIIQKLIQLFIRIL